MSSELGAIQSLQWRVLLPVLFSILHSQFSTAQSVVPLSLNQLIDHSDGVIRGTVSEVYTGVEEGGIYTWVDLADIEVISGDYANDKFTLKYCGGTWGMEGSDCGDIPTFDVGDRIVLFTEGNGKYELPFTGGIQGVFYENDGHYFLDKLPAALKNTDSRSVIEQAMPDSPDYQPSQHEAPNLSNSERKLTIQDIYIKASSVINEHRKLVSAKLPPKSNYVRRYPKLRNLITEDDWTREMELGSFSEKIEKLHRYAEWKGLSPLTLADINESAQYNKSKKEIYETIKNRVLSRVEQNLLRLESIGGKKSNNAIAAIKENNVTQGEKK